MGKWLSTLMSALWLLGTAGQAQQSPSPGELVPTRRLNLTMQDQHVIKELMKDLKLAPAATSAKAVGDVVAPDAVHEMPADVGREVPEVKAHRVVHTAERILIDAHSVRAAPSVRADMIFGKDRADGKSGVVLKNVPGLVTVGVFEVVLADD